MTLLAPGGASRLVHEEPFGPINTVVEVDTEAELLAQMNASNSALVASLACDDTEVARRLAEQVQAFEVGINSQRTRGDREEPFGGRGASWKGVRRRGAPGPRRDPGPTGRAPVRQLPGLLAHPGDLRHPGGQRERRRPGP